VGKTLIEDKEQKKIDRRKFVKVAAAGIMGAGLSLAGLKGVNAQTDPPKIS